MKKLLFLLMMPSLMFSQSQFNLIDGKVLFTEIVETKNIKSEESLFNTATEWASLKSSNFNRLNSEKNNQGTEIWLQRIKGNFDDLNNLYKNENPLKLIDKENHKIIIQVVNKYTGSNIGCVAIVYFKYDLILKFKEGKYKYEITNFVYNHYERQRGTRCQFYGFKDEGFCKSQGDLEELLKCDVCVKSLNKMYNYLIDDISILINDFKTNIDKEKSDSDW